MVYLYLTHAHAHARTRTRTHTHTLSHALGRSVGISLTCHRFSVISGSQTLEKISLRERWVSLKKSLSGGYNFSKKMGAARSPTRVRAAPARNRYPPSSPSPALPCAQTSPSNSQPLRRYRPRRIAHPDETLPLPGSGTTDATDMIYTSSRRHWKDRT